MNGRAVDHPKQKQRRAEPEVEHPIRAAVPGRRARVWAGGEIVELSEVLKSGNDDREPSILYYCVVQLSLPEFGCECATQGPSTEVRPEEGGLRRSGGTWRGQSRCLGTPHGPVSVSHP